MSHDKLSATFCSVSTEFMTVFNLLLLCFVDGDLLVHVKNGHLLQPDVLRHYTGCVIKKKQSARGHNTQNKVVSKTILRGEYLLWGF